MLVVVSTVELRSPHVSCRPAPRPCYCAWHHASIVLCVAHCMVLAMGQCTRLLVLAANHAAARLTARPPSYTLLAHPQERLYATYFAGDDDVPCDDEARELWLRYLPAERVLGAGKKDNFWEMGDTGPCGPCSELHYDRLGRGSVPELVNADDPTLIEIWNLVFMQFFRDESGTLIPLPAKHVDTGMGLERLTSILQDVHSNYDSDVFIPLFEAIQKTTGAREYSGKLGVEDVDGVDMAYRVIADHIRTLTFAITDGAVPSNEGRGYVLRRILRRAVRYGRQFLNAETGFFTKLVPVVVENFSVAFPELTKKQAFVMEVVADEEASFGRTLNRGLKAFNKMKDEVLAAGGKTLSGQQAFFLYDSMGFPLDLTVLMAEEAGLTVDEPGFVAAMAEQKARSAAAAGKKAGGKSLKLEAEQTAALADAGLPVTDDSSKYEWNVEQPATVLAVWDGEKLIMEAGAAITADMGTVGIITDVSSFYAESGGQEWDEGHLYAGDDMDNATGTFEVGNVQSFAGYVMHMGDVQDGQLTVGGPVMCLVDYDRRSHLAPNHTMTHVLNHALREVLAGEVEQRGSLVAPDKLRFDFSSNKGLTMQQLRAIDDRCNALIDDAVPVYTSVEALEGAKAINSLRAVFGERYPDPVRVVSVGQEIGPMVADPANEAWMTVPVEFCGGTHLRNTSQAGAFTVVEETSIAKGIRRVVAYTKEAARDAQDAGETMAARYAEARALSWQDLEARLPALAAQLNAAAMPAWRKMALRDEQSTLEKKMVKGRKEAAAAAAAAAGEEVAAAMAAAAEAGEAIVALPVSCDGKAMKDVTKRIKAAATSLGDAAPVVVVGVYTPGNDGKPGALLVSVHSPAHRVAGGLAAIDVVKAAAEAVGAVPRGKPADAQMSAKAESEDVLHAALAAARSFTA